MHAGQGAEILIRAEAAIRQQHLPLFQITPELACQHDLMLMNGSFGKARQRPAGLAKEADESDQRKTAPWFSAARLRPRELIGCGIGHRSGGAVKDLHAPAPPSFRGGNVALQAVGQMGADPLQGSSTLHGERPDNAIADSRTANAAKPVAVLPTEWKLVQGSVTYANEYERDMAYLRYSVDNHREGLPEVNGVVDDRSLQYNLGRLRELSDKQEVIPEELRLRVRAAIDEAMRVLEGD